MSGILGDGDAELGLSGVCALGGSSQFRGIGDVGVAGPDSNRHTFLTTYT